MSNQQLTFPCELTLRRLPEGLRVCRQVGFDDVGHCARYFKQAKGMSSTDY